MPTTETQIFKCIAEFGLEAHERRSPVEIASGADIDQAVEARAGVYWIETTMPVGEVQKAVSKLTGKAKRIRKTQPPGVGLIEQHGNEFYVAYSGTETNVRARLRQHLFNEGNPQTRKLGAKINEHPFNRYQWRVSVKYVSKYEVRYAVEAWWRLNIGWPAFCIR